jgi:hypothetical protein
MIKDFNFIRRLFRIYSIPVIDLDFEKEEIIIQEQRRREPLFPENSSLDSYPPEAYLVPIRKTLKRFHCDQHISEMNLFNYILNDLYASILEGQIIPPLLCTIGKTLKAQIQYILDLLASEYHREHPNDNRTIILPALYYAILLKENLLSTYDPVQLLKDVNNDIWMWERGTIHLYISYRIYRGELYVKYVFNLSSPSSLYFLSLSDPQYCHEFYTTFQEELLQKKLFPEVQNKHSDFKIIL